MRRFCSILFSTSILFGCLATAAPASVPHTVAPGETLWSIAAANNFTTRALAAANGLPADANVVAGTTIQIPSVGEAAAALGGAPAQQPSTPPTPPAPTTTPARVTAPQVGQIAAANGVPPSLAASIAWQESGFNNSMVSSANARGVMQMTPGAWNSVKNTQAGGSLNPGSANDNVKAGVLYLGSLLRSTGGSPDLAAAAYYQGLSSVRRVGMLPETRRYVANVRALRPRFGGP